MRHTDWSMDENAYIDPYMFIIYLHILIKVRMSSPAARTLTLTILCEMNEKRNYFLILMRCHLHGAWSATMTRSSIQMEIYGQYVSIVHVRSVAGAQRCNNLNIIIACSYSYA